jgi:hypothetical protein
MHRSFFFSNRMSVHKLEIFASKLGQMTQKAFLLLGKVAGDLHMHLYEKVAEAAAFEVFQSEAFQAKDLAGLGPRGNFQPLAAAERRDFYGYAERGLDKREFNFTGEVILLALKKIMLLDVNDDIQVSSSRLPLSRLSFAGDP